jgi:hypothetical protein
MQFSVMRMNPFRLPKSRFCFRFSPHPHLHVILHHRPRRFWKLRKESNSRILLDLGDAGQVAENANGTPKNGTHLTLSAEK